MTTLVQSSGEAMHARAQAANVPIMNFDIEDGPEFREDVFGQLDMARDAGPIIYSTAARGFWVLSDFNVVEEAIKSPTVFSNTLLEVHRTHDHVFPVLIPETLDPPVHHMYRTALSPMFSPRAVTTFEGKFRDRAAAYVDRIVGKKEVDFMNAVGRPLPADFFLALMDIPEDLHQQLTDALIVSTFTTPSDDPTGEIRMRAAQVINDSIAALVAGKQRQPGDDIFSQIMKREVDGRLLNEKELISIATLLASAGVETTGGLLGYIFEFLASHPEHRKQINDNLDNLVPPIEEFLRKFPNANSSRVVMENIVFHGVEMRRGDRVVINRIGANRDPRLVENGDQVDLFRKFNKHATFGDGIHACLGAHVARREIRLALEEWHKRIPNYRLADDYVPHHHVGTTISPSALLLVLE